MKFLAAIPRVLLGLIFVVIGSNVFWHFLPMGSPPTGAAGDFSRAMIDSHYMQVVGALQVLGGALCLIGIFVPLGLTLLVPVIVNILLFHFLLLPQGMPIAITTGVLALIVLVQNRGAFAGLLKP
jgi:hypothetical protein